MSSTVKQRSFWSTTSGVVTGIAGTITGVVTLVTVAAQMGWIGGDGDDPSSVNSQGSAVTQPATGPGSGGSRGPSGSGGATGSASATTPTFTVDPTRLSFEPLGSRTATVKVVNTGSVAATVESPMVEGSNPTQFTATAPTCTRAPLAPGRTCEVEVTFAPQRAGTYAAELVIEVDGARAQEVTLSGTAPLG